MMKRAANIVLLVLALLSLGGCAKSFKDIRLTSCSIVSLSPRGFTAVDAVVEVGVDNPAPEFVLSDISGVVKLDGRPCLNLSAGQVSVQGRTSGVYSVPVRGTLPGGFNPFSLLTLLQNADLSRITVDVSARASLRGGVGKEIELKDLPLDRMLGAARESDVI